MIGLAPIKFSTCNNKLLLDLLILIIIKIFLQTTPLFQTN